MGGKKAYTEHSQPLLDYVRTHTKFFLLLTMVFGGLTGVGIWFTIALLNPSATSTLIHTFVFGWATEWVCFLGEIIALFIYFYTFGKLSPGRHLKIGWLYFIFAWLSLFLINGIIDFMLTPGRWVRGVRASGPVFSIPACGRPFFSGLPLHSCLQAFSDF